MSEPVDPQELGWQQYPQYGQPQYPVQPQYGQPQYPGQVPYPALPFSVYPPPPEPPRRRPDRRVTAAIASVVVAAGVVVAIVVAGNSSSTNSAASSGPLPMPASLNGQPRITDATADRFRTEMQSLFGTTGESGELVSNGTIGVYGPAADPTSRIILLAAHASLFADLSPSSLSGSVFGGVGTGQSFPTGSNGGTLECLATNLGQIDESICIWVDKTTIGFVVAVNSSLSADAVASLTNTARDTIDH